MGVNVLRSFLFLDDETVGSYLSGLGLLTEAESIKNVTEKSRGLPGANSLPVKNESKVTVETIKQVAQTDATRFQKLYEYLEDSKILSYYEAMDSSTWSSIQRNDILEVGVELAAPRMNKFMDLIGQILELAPLIERATGEPLIKEDQQGMAEMLRTLSESSQEGSVPISMPFAGNSDYTLISHLLISALISKADKDAGRGLNPEHSQLPILAI